MDATLDKGVLTLKLHLTAPTLSKTGKSFLVYSTSGFAKLPVEINGKPISVSINAIIPK